MKEIINVPFIYDIVISQDGYSIIKKIKYKKYEVEIPEDPIFLEYYNDFKKYINNLNFEKKFDFKIYKKEYKFCRRDIAKEAFFFEKDGKIFSKKIYGDFCACCWDDKNEDISYFEDNNIEEYNRMLEEVEKEFRYEEYHFHHGLLCNNYEEIE